MSLSLRTHYTSGVYIFSHKAMKELVETTNHNSLGDVIPVAITQPDRYRVYAHKFQGNWTPIRTLREWFETNLSLTAAKPASVRRCRLTIIRLTLG